MADTKRAIKGSVFRKITKKQEHSILCLESLRNIVKDAFKDRFTDKQITEALVGMGIPKDGFLELNEFHKLVSRPFKMFSSEDDIGRWLSTEQWQSVLTGLGIRRSLDETRELVELTRKQIIGEMKPRKDSATLLDSGKGDGMEPSTA